MSRSRALAEALMVAGAHVTFCCRTIFAGTEAELVRCGISVVHLADEEAFLSQDWNGKIVVVDGYQFGEDFWRRLLATHPLLTVCIDDLRDISYQADLVICYNEGVNESQFRLTAGSRLMLGGRYLLLRPEVGAAARLTNKPTPRRAVMIAAGGTRQEQWVIDMLTQLSVVEPRAPLWVLSGQRLSSGKVARRTGVYPGRVRFFSGLEPVQMLWLYRRARYLVVPASTMMLEAFATGCPVISGWVADNQRNSLEYYSKHGLIVNVGDLRCATSDVLTRASCQLKRQAGQMARRQRAYISAAKVGVLEIVQAILANVNYARVRVGTTN